MPRYHRYKNKPGGYWRGYSPLTGKYYTERDNGCSFGIMLLSIVLILIVCMFLITTMAALHQKEGVTEIVDIPGFYLTEQLGNAETSAGELVEAKVGKCRLI